MATSRVQLSGIDEFGSDFDSRTQFVVRSTTPEHLVSLEDIRLQLRQGVEYRGIYRNQRHCNLRDLL